MAFILANLHLQLVRCMVRALLTVVFAQNGKKVVSIRKMNDMLTRFVLNGSSKVYCPLSLSTHIVDIYLEEVKFTSKGKVGGAFLASISTERLDVIECIGYSFQLTPKMILRLVTPFCEIMTSSNK